jgi:hypothetical protein
MTLDEFVKKNKGEKLDFDDAFGAQCMDLYRFYVRDVLVLPQSPPVIGAKNVWDTYLKQYYTRVRNTLSAIPEKGDIVIWGERYGKFGHIAVILEADLRKFIAFSQNDPLGKPCIIKEYRYDRILGWLHPKAEAIVKITDQTKIPIGGDWGQMEVQAIRSSLNDQKRDIENLQGSIKSLTDTLNEQKKNFKEFNKKLTTARQRIQTLSEDREKLKEKIEKMKIKEPVFDSSVAKLFYRIAKRLG